jgi:phosphatidylserine synthase
LTISLKDLTTYSGILSIGFYGIAILTQTPDIVPFRAVAVLKEHGNAGVFVAFVLAVAFSFLMVSTAKIWRYLDHVYLRDKLIPSMAALLFAFGLTACASWKVLIPFPQSNSFGASGLLRMPYSLWISRSLLMGVERPRRNNEPGRSEVALRGTQPTRET